MDLNKISAELTQEQEAQIMKLIKEVKEALPFLVNLSSDERKRLAKLSRSRVDFVDTALVHIQAKPEYLPPYVSAEEFAKDVNLKNSMQRIQAEMDSLGERINDTIMLADSEAYRASRLFYKSIKAAAREGAEDAERIARELAYHYRKQGPGKLDGSTDLEEETETGS